MSILNFLPRRQQRRARCLRFWGAMCIGTVLLMFVVIVCLRMNQFVKLRALQTDLTGMQSVQHALVARQNWPHRRSYPRKPATTRMATGAGLPFPRHSFTGLADRAALSAACADFDRLRHHPAGPLCPARWAGTTRRLYARDAGRASSG